MYKKKDMSANFFSNTNYLVCPYCKKKLRYDNYSLRCINNHNFDISKKGVCCLLDVGKFKKNYVYDANLFINRRNFILNKFYDSMYSCIIEIINKEFANNSINILDLGCGEGTHDKFVLEKLKQQYSFLGLDYNKNAIGMALDYANNSNAFVVSDVNNLPIKSDIFDVIINILSPYYSDEVLRVMKSDGVFIKVIPSKNYLIEVRKQLGFNEYEKEDILKTNLKKHFFIIKEFEINENFSINNRQLKSLFEMTPIVKSKRINKSISNLIVNSVTINLKILIMRRKKDDFKICQ